ncbi:glycosyltransferase family 2 protein [Mesonia maritima]|uniref:Glycosyltransferase 2-like domain-containing protein n=1 Tax=Mesonia maritima TaxID=1793873 RepID=A0ABU1K5N8_9FLAO|nr:glycosyltransferase family 2 protein [Mesonia maritima]MDR6300922.1 hypothetical protein [Mesonia maritima]
MEIAVVILNWNGKALLERFLPSVINNSSEATIYVADNASTDNSVDFVKANFPEVKIIQNSVNGGYAKGYNDALAHISEDIFILLNSDVEVTKNWLRPFIQHFEKNRNTAILQPKILDFKRKDYFEYAGAAGGFIDKLGYPFCRGRIFETLEKDTNQYNSETPIFWASGACLAIRKEVFFEIGKLDEDYFAHQEEIDLCWRAFNAGYEAFYIPDSKIYHVGGATLQVMNPKKTFYNFRNSLYNLLKNVPYPQFYFLIFLRMILDGIAGFKFLLEGKPAHFSAILKAHGSFYRNFSKMIKKRPKNHRKNYFQVKSIVWKYYILKQKHFKKL